MSLVIIIRLEFLVQVVLSEAKRFIIPLAANIKGNFNLKDTMRCRRDAYSKLAD